jgi:hypothetical protein
MSGGYVTKLLKEGVITAMLTPPSILEDISEDPEGIKELAKLKKIGYAGGPLQPSVSHSAFSWQSLSLTIYRLVSGVQPLAHCT